MPWSTLCALLVLIAVPARPAAAATYPVCGVVEAAPTAGATLELLPMVPAHRWALGLLGGESEPSPTAVAEVVDGRYCLDAPPGLWRVVARAPGHVPLVRFPLAVTGPVTLPSARLPRDEGVTVTVTDADGRAAGDAIGTAWVVAMTADEGERPRNRADGWRPDLRFAEVPPGGRVRLPRSPGETLDLRLLTAGSATVVTGRSAGAPIHLVIPTTRTTHSLEILDERGAPQANVTATRVGAGWPVGVTDGDGRLDLASPPEEAVDLVLEAEDGRRRRVRLETTETETRVKTIELPPTPTLHGRVVEDGSRRPLPGALVWLGPDPGTHGVAGADGTFSLPGGGRESVRVEAAAADHLRRATVVDGGEARGPSGVRSADLALPRAGELAGRVVDGEGRPVAGAEVRARASADSPTVSERTALRERPPGAVSGPDGRFTLRDLAAGRALDLLTLRTGYLPAWTLGVEVAARRAPGASRESAPGPTVVLEPASRLAGLVVDSEGEPVPAARVGLAWERGPAGTVGLGGPRPASRSTPTDTDGRFVFDELAAGAVTLSARAPGFLSSEDGRAVLPPGGEVTGIRLVLDRGSWVEGTVFGPDGSAVSGAELRIGATHALSGATGAFRVEGVPPGPAALQTHHPDYRRGLQEIEVRPGANTIDVHLEDGWSVSGRAVDEDGRAVAGARIELWPDRSEATTGYGAVSSEDGRFRLVASEPGGYRLAARHPDFAPAEVGGLELAPEPGSEVEDVEVVLTTGASVSGRIVGLSAEELGGVVVEARSGGAAASGVVTAGGEYAVRHLAPGSWRVQAELAGGRRRAAATVLLDASDAEAIRDLEFGGGLRLDGRVTYDGEPIAGAHVHLAGRTASGERSVVTAHDGRFALEDLAPGRYRLDVLDRRRALSHVQNLDLERDREVRLDLESEPLTGRVTDAESGAGLDEATVTVRKAVGAAGDLGPMIEIPTDAAGGFVIAHATPGDFVVAARKSGYAPADTTVRVVAGSPPAPVALRLQPAGGVTLAVSLADGGTPRMVTVAVFDATRRLLLHDTRRATDRGFVRFDQIPNGTWDLLVAAPGTAPTWTRATVPDDRPRVVLPPAAPLTVRVPALVATDAGGELTLRSATGEPFYQLDPAGEVRTRWTLSGGLVTLTDVPAGTWIVEVSGPGGATWTGTAMTDGRTPGQVTLE